MTLPPEETPEEEGSGDEDSGKDGVADWVSGLREAREAGQMTPFAKSFGVWSRRSRRRGRS